MSETTTTSGGGGWFGVLQGAVQAAGAVALERERSRNVGSNANPATASPIPDRPQPDNPADQVAARTGGNFFAELPAWAKVTLGASLALLGVALAIKLTR